MPPGLIPPATVALNAAFNTSALPAPAMATTQLALGRRGATGQRQRAAHTIGESSVVAAAVAEAATMPAGWKPSRFFGAWKMEVNKKAGFDVYWSTMGHYEILTPKAKGRIIKTILRTTIASKAYDSDDFYEGVLASHDDYEAMQAYAAAFVDAFWQYYWTGRHNVTRTAGVCCEKRTS